MSSYDDNIRRWREAVFGSKKMPLKGPSVFYEGDKIYSYGYHFELGRALRDKKGKVETFLLNGDTYSVTTARHQSSLRWTLHHDRTVIIPYEALESAGVLRETIKVLEVTADSNEVIQHHSTEMPEGAKWHDEPIMGYVDLTPEEYAAKLKLRNAQALQRHEEYVERHANRPEIWEEPGEFQPLTKLDSWDGQEYKQIGTNHVLRPGRNKWQEIHVSVEDDGTTVYSWETHIHHLGESLIRAKVAFTDKTYKRHYRWATFLSGWDMQETRPLYFLSEMPYRFKGTTVEEAYEALKPEPVVLAEGLGRDVKRQGDIFAVPAPSLDKRTLRAKGARFEKRGYILKTNHVATEVAYLPGGLTLARGTLYHAPDRRQPDHARRTIGREWHIVTKNTVPTTKRSAA